MWKWLRNDLGETLERTFIRVQEVEETLIRHENAEEGRYSTLLQEVRKMGEKTDAAIGRLGQALKDAITKETQELKDKIASVSGDDAAAADAIDAFASNLTSSIDKISDDVSSTTPPDDGGGETPVP